MLRRPCRFCTALPAMTIALVCSLVLYNTHRSISVSFHLLLISHEPSTPVTTLEMLAGTRETSADACWPFSSKTASEMTLTPYSAPETTFDPLNPFFEGSGMVCMDWPSPSSDDDLPLLDRSRALKNGGESISAKPTRSPRLHAHSLLTRITRICLTAAYKFNSKGAANTMPIVDPEATLRLEPGSLAAPLDYLPVATALPSWQSQYTSTLELEAWRQKFGAGENATVAAALLVANNSMQGERKISDAAAPSGHSIFFDNKSQGTAVSLDAISLKQEPLIPVYATTSPCRKLGVDEFRALAFQTMHVPPSHYQKPALFDIRPSSASTSAITSGTVLSSEQQAQIAATLFGLNLAQHVPPQVVDSDLYLQTLVNESSSEALCTRSFPVIALGVAADDDDLMDAEGESVHDDSPNASPEHKLSPVELELTEFGPPKRNFRTSTVWKSASGHSKHDSGYNSEASNVSGDELSDDGSQVAVRRKTKTSSPKNKRPQVKTKQANDSSAKAPSDPLDGIPPRVLSSASQDMFHKPPSSLNPTQLERVVNSIMRKRSRNTEAARRSRCRRRDELQSLEDKIGLLRKENVRLKLRLQELVVALQQAM